jgi:hypothetical protein
MRNLFARSHFRSGFDSGLRAQRQAPTTQVDAGASATARTKAERAGHLACNSMNSKMSDNETRSITQ